MRRTARTRLGRRLAVSTLTRASNEIAARPDQFIIITCSINDEKRRSRLAVGAVSLGMICHLVADARTKLKPASVVKLSLELAGEAKENMALLAPMIRTIPS